MDEQSYEKEVDITSYDWKNISAEELVAIIDAYRERRFTEEIDEIEALGGIDNFQSLLKVSFIEGLSGDDFIDRAAKFGDNKRKEIKRLTFLQFCLEAMKDKIMIILLSMGVFSLMIELFTGNHPEYGWIEGFAIIFAVLVVVVVTGINDYQKEKKFLELQNLQLERNRCQVLRAGNFISIHSSELMVGDIVELSDGNIIPADGVLVSSQGIEIDESSMTGENDKRKKEQVEKETNINADIKWLH